VVRFPQHSLDMHALHVFQRAAAGRGGFCFVRGV
jgi:hypothetical protein